MAEAQGIQGAIELSGRALMPGDRLSSSFSLSGDSPPYQITHSIWLTSFSNGEQVKLAESQGEEPLAIWADEPGFGLSRLEATDSAGLNLKLEEPFVVGGLNEAAAPDKMMKLTGLDIHAAGENESRLMGRWASEDGKALFNYQGTDAVLWVRGEGSSVDSMIGRARPHEDSVSMKGPFSSQHFFYTLEDDGALVATLPWGASQRLYRPGGNAGLGLMGEPRYEPAAALNPEHLNMLGRWEGGAETSYDWLISLYPDGQFAMRLHSFAPEGLPSSPVWGEARAANGELELVTHQGDVYRLAASRSQNDRRTRSCT